MPEAAEHVLAAAAIERELVRWGWEPPTRSVLMLCAARALDAAVPVPRAEESKPTPPSVEAINAASDRGTVEETERGHTPERKAHLGYPPRSENEVRVSRGDCVVSIWLPASLDDVSAALTALGEQGFEFHKGDPDAREGPVP